MSVSCECCLLSGRGLCVGPITRWEESYRVWCVLNVTAMRRQWGDSGPLGLSSHGRGMGLHSAVLLEKLLSIVQAAKKFTASYRALRIHYLIHKVSHMFSIINQKNLIHNFALVLFKAHLIFFWYLLSFSLVVPPVFLFVDHNLRELFFLSMRVPHRYLYTRVVSGN